MISESTPVFLNTPAAVNMEETPDFNWEMISAVPAELEASCPTSTVSKDNPWKEDSEYMSRTAKEVLVNQSLAIDDVKETGKDTTIFLEETDDILVNPLGNQGTQTTSQARDDANIETDKLNQKDDAQETCLEDNVEEDVENEKLSEPQAPLDVASPSAGAKMKFQVVHNNGRMTLRVARNDQQPSPQGRKSLVATPTTPKTRSKQRRSSDTGTPQRTKTTDKSIGGKTRNKVMSPLSSTIDSKSSISSPNKPLMDLRHILKKYEKKKEPVPQQQMCEVGFYGSLSAIPFLTMSNDKASEKTTTEKGIERNNGPCDSISPNQQTKVGTDSLNDPEEETIPQKPRLPTREEIVITAEYDEEQLKLWKSMNALDSSLGRIQRPQEMLPLRPGVRTSEKRMMSPRSSAVRAYSRPEDWLSHPEWNASQKSYRSTSSDEQPDDGVLFMEPDN